MSDNYQRLLDDLRDSNPDKRESALDAITSMHLENAFSLILTLKDDPEQEVRSSVACNLKYVNTPESVKYLITMADTDVSEMVRGEALASLSQYRSPEILDCLLRQAYRKKILRRPHQEVAKQLRYYDTEAAVDALMMLLKDEDVDVRDFAAESLYRLNRSRLVDAWKEALKDKSQYVRRFARKALMQLK
jgi:HEAT repeat protein